MCNVSVCLVHLWRLVCLVPLQLSLEAVNARLVEKTRELNVAQIENEKLKVHTYMYIRPSQLLLCVSPLPVQCAASECVSLLYLICLIVTYVTVVRY